MRRSSTRFFAAFLPFLFLLIHDPALAQGPPGGGNGNNGNGNGGGQGGPPVWRLDGNSLSSGDFLGSTNNRPLILKTNGTERLRLLPTGDLGVGTSSPSHTLTVNGTFGVMDTSFLQTTRVSGPFYLQNGTQGSEKVLTGNAQGKGIWTDLDSVNFWQRSGNLLYYQGGKVGIGTNSPLKAFDVNGDALIRDTLYVNDGLRIGNVLRADANETRIKSSACVTSGSFGVGGGTSSGYKFSVQGNARIHGETTTDSLQVNGRTEFGYATFDSLKVGDSSIVLGAQAPEPSTPNNTISTTGNEPLLLSPENLSNLHTGNIGIGTTDPKRKLHVKTYHKISSIGGGVINGSHWGMRLENTTENLNTGNTRHVTWDIEPKGNNFNAGKGLYFTPGGKAQPNYVMKDNGLLAIAGTYNKWSFRDIPSSQKNAENRIKLGVGGDAIFRPLNNDFGQKALRVGHDGANAFIRSMGGPLLMNYYNSNTVTVGAPSGSSQGSPSDLRVTGRLAINSDPNTSPASNYRLSVDGIIYAKEIIVEDGWSDYVFEEDYELPTLREEASYINKNGHLMDMPSGEKVLAEGLSLGNLTKLQQREIEEIYLHLIRMKKEMEKKEKERKEDEKRIELLKEQNERLREQNKQLKKQVNALKE